MDDDSHAPRPSFPGTTQIVTKCINNRETGFWSRPCGGVLRMPSFYFVLCLSLLFSSSLVRIQGCHGSKQTDPTSRRGGRRTREVATGVLAAGAVEEADGWIHGNAKDGDMAIDLSQVIFTSPLSQEGLSFNTSNTTRNATLDIAMFRLPSTCGPSNCDYPRMGVGRYIPVEESPAGLRLVAWCDGLVGRLYLDPHRFEGIHIELSIPYDSDMTEHQPNQTVYPVGKSGHYMILISNCNQLAERTVYFEGQVVFSSHEIDSKFVNRFKNWGFVAIAVIYLSAREYNGQQARQRRQRQRLGQEDSTTSAAPQRDDYDAVSAVEMISLAID
jgi:hypothetical protein